jgi:2-keto-3-deoxy-L-rhamnonate aldolase RhmA
MPGVKPGSEYDDVVAKDLLVVVQIESQSGLDNVEKIAQTDGVDVLFIGMLLALFNLSRTCKALQVVKRQ